MRLAAPCLNTYFEYSIPNPLTSFSPLAVLSQVEEFVENKGLNKFMHLFKTAALVAHRPQDYQTINESIERKEEGYASLRPLDPEELEFLGDEEVKRFNHPRELYWTIALCSMGAAVQ